MNCSWSRGTSLGERGLVSQKRKYIIKILIVSPNVFCASIGIVVLLAPSSVQEHQEGGTGVLSPHLGAGSGAGGHGRRSRSKKRSRIKNHKGEGQGQDDMEGEAKGRTSRISVRSSRGRNRTSRPLKEEQKGFLPISRVNKRYFKPHEINVIFVSAVYETYKIFDVTF